MDRVLTSVCDSIRNSLAEKARKLYKDKTDSIRDASGLKDLIKKRKDIDNSIKLLQKKYNQVCKDISCKDGAYYDVLDQELKDISIATGKGYGWTQMEVKALKAIKDSKEAVNLMNFQKLERNTRNMYNLACTQKEKRAIIFQLQKRDWRSIGVDIPELPYFEEFKIEGGKIVMPALKSLPKGE